MGLMRLKNLHKPRPEGTLKAAVARLVDSVGGVVRAADLTRRSRSQIQRCTDDAAPDAMRVDDVRTLETAARAAGIEPVVTAFLAAEQGCVLLRIPDDGIERCLNEDFARLGAASGKLFGRYAEALGDDGIIDAREAGQLVADTDEVLAALAACRTELMARMRAPQ